MIKTKEYDNSSWVWKIVYDTEAKTMTVEPKQGNRIIYRDFTEKMWTDCLEAESIGKHIHSVLKPMYKKEPEKDEE